MVSQSQKLKRSQYVLLFAGFIHGSHLLFGGTESQLSQDFCLILIIAFLLSIPQLLVYTTLIKKYPDSSLVQILEKVFGKILGKAMATLYFLYFLCLISFNLSDISVYFVGLVMQDMPQAVIIVVIALTCAYAVKKGMGSLAKICELSIAFGIFTPVITFLLLLGNMDFSNFRPVLEMPLSSYVHPLGLLVLVPFGEAVVILMMGPYINEKKKLGMYTIGGLSIVLMIFLIIGLRNTAVLGSITKVYPYPSFHTVRVVDIADFLTRIELLIALVVSIASFVKISVLYYASVKSISQILHVGSYSSLILPIGSIAVAFALVVFESPAAHAKWIKNYAILFSVPFTIVIPLLALIVSLLRNKSQNE